MGVIANVLTGVAKLYVKEPNDAIAEWSTAQKQAGSYSAKLYKSGSGSDGSTYVQLVPPAGITLTDWTTGIAAGKYSFYHHCSAVHGNFGQVEFRFQDLSCLDTPEGNGHVDITGVPLQNLTGTADWVQELLPSTTLSGYYGNTLGGASFGNFVLAAFSAQEAAIVGHAPTAATWILTRVRFELWEPTPERTCYIDTVKINGVVYTIEPGGTAPGVSFGSPYTEVGYTNDGVTVEYNADEADIEVEEETFAIGRVITKEALTVTCNMAESSLYNIDKAMAGSVLSGSIITLGGGTNKTMNLKIEGTNPAGFTRTIFVPLATSTGSVGQSYKKGEKTVVPVTFQALKGDSDACYIVDNAA